MPQKLLQKRRNKHLQQTSLENLIPNKPVRKKERGRGAGILLLRVEEELRNHWVFFWNVLKGKMFSSVQAPFTETIQEKNSLRHILPVFPRDRKESKSCSPSDSREKGKLFRRNELQIFAQGFFWNRRQCSRSPISSEREIVESFVYLLDYQTSRRVGGNIIQFLNQYAFFFATHSLRNNATEELRKARAIEARFFSNGNQLASAALPQFYEKGIKKLKNSGKSEKDACFSIYWDKKEAFVADFLNEQMQRYLYYSLYTLHELSIKRGRIKDLRKNQYTECRKIGILYGNLPKRTLTRIMRRARKGGGNLDCKFLSTLERRLDVQLKRILFFPTIKSARQWINAGNVLVNNCTCTTPGYLLQPADLIHIRKKMQTTWRAGWFKHFSKMRDSKIFLGIGHTKNLPVVKNVSKKELIKPLFSPAPQTQASEKSTQVHFKGKRRFLLSPSLLRQWKEWSLLWGNRRKSRGCEAYPGDGIELHRWAVNSYQWMQYTHNLFQNSALGGFFNKNGGVLHAARRKTAVTSWLRKIRVYLLSKKNGRVLSVASLRNKPRDFSKRTFSIEKTREKRKRTEYANQRESDRTSLLLRRCINATALHQQQALVLDGLFIHRWSKVFAKIKKLAEKRKDWRYSCIKPMHIECSYQHGSAIFLYASQKLAWPSSINVFLLRKALL